MKKLLPFLLSAVLLVSMLCGGVLAVTYIPGDINGDTKVNIRDLGTLQQFLNGWNVELKYGGVDMNTTTTVKRPATSTSIKLPPVVTTKTMRL